MRKLMSLFLFFICISFVVTNTALSEDLKLGGGAPPIEKAVTPIKDAFQKSTGITIRDKMYGPKFALIDLERGEIEAAVLFLSMEEIAALAKKENISIDTSLLKQATVGKDVIKIVLNKNNPVTSLTKEQAKGILTGKITNWKEVGGNDAVIIFVSGTLIKGVNEIVTKVILNGQPYAKDALMVEAGKDVITTVSLTPEAIGLSSTSLVNDSVKALVSPEITVPISIYTKGAPSPKVQKLIDFIKK